MVSRGGFEMSRRSQRIAKMIAQQDPQDRLMIPSPVPTPMVMPGPSDSNGLCPQGSPKVYLAGKIGKWDWRHSIFKGLRESSPGSPPRDMDGFAYAGPYFLSCDHGCYHGRGSHGVGADEDGRFECSETPVPPVMVVQRCRECIRSADVVFAFIDGANPYGTILELGLAIGLGKPVYLAYGLDCDDEDERGISGRERFDRLHRLVADTWLAAEFAGGFRIFGTAPEAWQEFVSWHRDLMLMPPHPR
jgi:hypothetical protein